MRNYKVLRFTLIVSTFAVILLVGYNSVLPSKSVESKQIQGEKMNLEEASMNFDSENVRPFLERLKPLIESGFSDKEIAQIQQMLENLKVDEEKELEFPIRFKGIETVLRVRIFLDDVEAPDVYFYTDAKLAKEIDKQLEEFADELGI